MGVSYVRGWVSSVCALVSPVCCLGLESTYIWLSEFVCCWASSVWDLVSYERG